MAYGKPSGHELRLRMAQEAMQITANRCYPVRGDIVPLPECNYARAKYLGDASLAFITEQMETQIYELPEFSTEYLVTKEDSLDAAAGRDDQGPTLVMNFANAHEPGGRFLTGGRGQEESLCRNSTLYASLCSPDGVLLYLHNNLTQLPVDSDCMSLSPTVVVFRAGNGNLLERPFTTSVISVPAPDRRQRAREVEEDVLNTVMTRRIEKMVLTAAYYGYRTLILGAWGCGAYLHEARQVAEYFREVLVDREFGRLFARIVFAVFDRHSNEKLDMFRDVFNDMLDEDNRRYVQQEVAQRSMPGSDNPDLEQIVHVNMVDLDKDHSQQEIFCKLENRLVTLNHAKCGAKCPHFAGIGNGDAIECIWPDERVNGSEQHITEEDQHAQMERVHELIEKGILREG